MSARNIVCTVVVEVLAFSSQSLRARYKLRSELCAQQKLWAERLKFPHDCNLG